MWSVILDFLSIVFVLILYPLSFEIYSTKNLNLLAWNLMMFQKRNMDTRFKKRQLKELKNLLLNFFIDKYETKKN